MMEGTRQGVSLDCAETSVSIAMMRIPDGHGQIELSHFLTPPIVADHRNRPVNALGYLRVMFAVDDLDDTLARLRRTRHSSSTKSSSTEETCVGSARPEPRSIYMGSPGRSADAARYSIIPDTGASERHTARSSDPVEDQLDVVPVRVDDERRNPGVVVAAKNPGAPFRGPPASTAARWNLLQRSASVGCGEGHMNGQRRAALPDPGISTALDGEHGPCELSTTSTPNGSRACWWSSGCTSRHVLAGQKSSNREASRQRRERAGYDLAAQDPRVLYNLAVLSMNPSSSNNSQSH